MVGAVLLCAPEKRTSDKTFLFLIHVHRTSLRTGAGRPALLYLLPRRLSWTSRHDRLFQWCNPSPLPKTAIASEGDGSRDGPTVRGEHKGDVDYPSSGAILVGA